MLSIDTIAAQELDAYKDRDDVLIIDLRDSKREGGQKDAEK